MANESLYQDNNINGMRISFTRVQKEQKKKMPKFHLNLIAELVLILQIPPVLLRLRHDCCVLGCAGFLMGCSN